MSTSLSPHPEVAVILPSLPPSPSFLDEVFSHPRPWSVRLEDFDLHSSRRSSPGSAGSYAKGKEKQIAEVEEEGEDSQHRVSPHEAYPPMTDENAETRRVEETLKRWELAERQRRKSARESVRHTSSPSLLSTVTRTAGLVLSGRTSTGTSVGPGSPRTFKSHTIGVAREGYFVPLDDIDHTHSSADVAVHSPPPSLFDRNMSSDAGTRMRTSENPFVHPSERARTLTPPLTLVTAAPMPPSSYIPFGDTHAQEVMGEDLGTRMSIEGKTHAGKRSLASGTPVVPLPLPLDLPPPLGDIPARDTAPTDTTTSPSAAAARRSRGETRGPVVA
ncbi:hypothetical protein HD554DRAFT_1647795 [Boletus coccyginus]|nr:hypothetical protein HD554DRAFT_1647795 [Boletus coccyginus]